MFPHLEDCLPRCWDGIVDLGKVDLSQSALQERNLWLSLETADLTTTWHYDSYNNVLLVLHGKKTVRMTPPYYQKVFRPYQVGKFILIKIEWICDRGII